MDATTDRSGEEESLRAKSRRRSVLILILAFWAFAVLMLSIRALLIDTLPLAVLGPRRLATAIVGTFLCLGMARLLWTVISVSSRSRAPSVRSHQPFRWTSEIPLP